MAEGEYVLVGEQSEDDHPVDNLGSFCCVCLNKGIKTEASNYCSNCLDYYCEECLKLHDVVPCLTGHVVVDKTEMKKSKASLELLQIPTMRCPEHPAKILDMYCRTHHQVGCTTCFTLNHSGSTCDKLYIPKHIESLFRSKEIVQTEKDLSSSIQQLQDALAVGNTCKQELLRLKNSASEAMESYVNEIITTVGELKENTKASLDKLFKNSDAVIEKQNEKIDIDLSKAEHVLNITKRANDTANKAQKYVCNILATSTANHCKVLTERLSYPDVKSVCFTPLVSCKNLFQCMLKYNLLGTFNIVQPNKVLNSRTIEIHENNDRHICNIVGSCILSDGTILLTDRNNHRLKRLNLHRSSVCDHLDLPEGVQTPWSVCAMDKDQAAVTLPSLKQVQFVYIGEKMKSTGTVKLDYQCYGIAYHGGELFVSERYSKVHVYSETMKFERKIDLSHSEVRSIYQMCIWNMIVSNYGGMLYIADARNGLIKVDTKTGNIVDQFAMEKLSQSVTDACEDGRGNLFLCGETFHNVLQISENGEKVSEVIAKGGVDEFPQTLCFDKSSNELFISSRNQIVVVIFAQ